MKVDQTCPKSVYRQLMKSSIFTPEELELIRVNYFNLGPTKLSCLMSGKTPQQIASRGAYEGLVFNPELIGKHAENKEDIRGLIDVQTPMVAYILGFLWADGTVSKRSSYVGMRIIRSDFEDIKTRWMETAKSWRYSYYHDGHPNHQPQVAVAINHKDYNAFLTENDYLVKSGASADKILSKIPDHLKHYWWRGYYDGDGGFTAHKSTRRISLTSTWDQDWGFFAALAEKIDISYRVSVRKTKPSRNSSIMIENEANLRRFMEYIYQGEMFGLQRKIKAYQQYLTYKANVRPNKTSQYRGVHFDKTRNKWAMSFHKGRTYRARFETEKEAALAYDALALKLCGNKAVLNFPP